jgi:hypothetical protein
MKEKDLSKQKKNFKKTILFTFVLSLTAMAVSAWIQIKGQNGLNNCSYFDPMIIDFAAFSASLFLIIEGLIGIFKHRSFSISNQFARIIRVSMGFAILTLHIIQIFHK